MGSAIAVDLGGTKIAAASVTADGVVGPVSEAPTPAQDGPTAVLDVVAHLVERVREPGATCLGVGSAGTIDPDTSVVLAATSHLPGWEGTALGAELESRCRLPVSIENDVAAMGRGEAWRGAAAGCARALVLAVGTGLGGAFLCDGLPVGGPWGGRWGHVGSPAAIGEPCACGGVGHVEAVCSGAAIERRYITRAGVHRTGREIGILAAEHDPIAVEVLGAAMEALSILVLDAQATLAPEAVVVSGGVLASPMAWHLLMGALGPDRGSRGAPGPRIRRSELGVHAVLLGAARQALADYGD